MSYIQNTMKRYLEEILYCVENGNKKGVISLINEMKNFYMIEEGLKLSKKIIPLNEPIKVTEAIGKEIPNIPNNDKPRKHTFY